MLDHRGDMNSCQWKDSLNRENDQLKYEMATLDYPRQLVCSIMELINGTWFILSHGHWKVFYGKTQPGFTPGHLAFQLYIPLAAASLFSKKQHYSYWCRRINFFPRDFFCWYNFWYCLMFISVIFKAMIFVCFMKVQKLKINCLVDLENKE